jgi:hypothetical protein
MNRPRAPSGLAAPRGAGVGHLVTLLPWGLVDLDGVPVWILDLDLLATGTHLELISESSSSGFECGDGGVDIVDVQDDSVPPARFLPVAVGHRP